MNRWNEMLGGVNVEICRKLYWIAADAEAQDECPKKEDRR